MKPENVRQLKERLGIALDDEGTRRALRELERLRQLAAAVRGFNVSTEMVELLKPTPGSCIVVRSELFKRWVELAEGAGQ
jgi:hypothetical protein